MAVAHVLGRNILSFSGSTASVCRPDVYWATVYAAEAADVVVVTSAAVVPKHNVAKCRSRLLFMLQSLDYVHYRDGHL